MGKYPFLERDSRIELYLYELAAGIIRLTNVLITANKEKFTEAARLEEIAQGNNAIQRLNHLHYQVTGNQDDLCGMDPKEAGNG